MDKINKKIWNTRSKIFVRYSSVVLIKNHLKDKYVIEIAKIPVTIRLINENDVEEYIQARNTNSKEDMLNRLSMGHIGTCAIYKGKIVSYTWQGINEIWIAEHKFKLILPPKHRYSYDGYTHPDYRRLGIYHELRTSSYPYYVEKGYPVSISLISPDNETSLQASKKTGGRKLGIIHTTCLLGFVYHSIESDNEINKNHIKDLFNWN